MRQSAMPRSTSIRRATRALERRSIGRRKRFDRGLGFSTVAPVQREHLRAGAIGQVGAHGTREELPSRLGQSGEAHSFAVLTQHEKENGADRPVLHRPPSGGAKDLRYFFAGADPAAGAAAFPFGDVGCICAAGTALPFAFMSAK
jgi:hypothetical protein